MLKQYNFYIFFIAVCLSSNVLSQNDQSCSITNNVSSLRPVIERVFSRKRRAILFPAGTALKFTGVFTKQLISSYPSGFNMILESALYYPCPGSLEDIYPKRLRKLTTTTQKPKSTKPVHVYIPGTDIRYKVKTVTKKPHPTNLHSFDRNDINSNNMKWFQPWPYNKFNKPETWLKWTKFGNSYHRSKYQWMPLKLQGNSIKQSTKFENNHRYSNERDWGNWTLNKNEQLKYRIHRPLNLLQHNFPDRNKDDNHKYKPMLFSDLEQLDDWKYYTSHRDRREFFHHFEGLSKFFGIDLKACILRTICNAKKFLLPPGFSMIQDIMRVFFQFPTIDGLEDEYSNIMRSDYEQCNNKLPYNVCPINLLHWLLNPNKATV